MTDLRLFTGYAFNLCARSLRPEKPAFPASDARLVTVHRPRRADGCDGTLPRRIIQAMLTIVMGALAVALSESRTFAMQSSEQPMAPAIDVAAAIQQFGQVQDWLDVDRTPNDIDLPAGAVGVWVGLRWQGRLVGSAHDIDAGNLDAPSNRALTGSVRRAWSDARQRVRGNDDPLVQSDREQQFRDSPGRSLEIEYAYKPVRIRASSLDGLTSRIRPGLDGILVRSGDATFAVFPAQMLAQDQTPRAALIGIIAQTGIDVSMLDEQIGDGRLRVWSFDTLHLTQPRRGEPPTVMVRGTRTVAQAAMTTAAIRQFTHDAAAYLAHHTMSFAADGSGPVPVDDTAPLILLGSYFPAVDQHDDLVASGYEQALSVLALGRFAQRGMQDEGQRESTLEVARRLLEGLSVSLAAREDPLRDPRTAALIVIALREFPQWRDSSVVQQLHEQATSKLAIAYGSASGYREGMSPEARALTAYALGTRDAIDAAWTSTDPSIRVLMLPWIASAELAQSSGTAAVAHAEELRELRDQAWAGQIGRDPLAIFSEDEVGAMTFRPGRPSGWESARLGTAFATMIAHSTLTPEPDRFNEIIALQRTVRFLRQLQIRDADAYRVRVLEAARGGIRTGLADQRTSAEATAFSLLFGVEFLSSLDRLTPSP